ncbi:MAG: AgmX/PglI C-terminal domain-containing protein [Fibrobacter sp.]|nr:AgmX/PglI C-terminal domain-containing protein [Fibrobacter sp.]
MRNRFTAVFCVLVILVCLCSKKKADNQKYHIFGTDTLSLPQINELDPVKNPDSIKIRNILVRKSLASADTGETNDSLLKILSNQLFRQSEIEWSDSASLLLQKASRVIIRKTASVKPVNIIAYADSLLFGKYGVKVSEHSGIVIDTGNDRSGQAVELIQKLLGVSWQVARVVYSFESDSEESTLSEEKLSEMVKGLLSVNDTITQKIKPKRKSIPQKKNNSLLALKYRNLESIQDSISVHIPALVDMYKQFLKNDENMFGVVIVSFSVSADGKVADAVVSRSDIKDAEFLKKLIFHARTIRFSSIPDSIGDMTFEFPFEFNAEM